MRIAVRCLVVLGLLAIFALPLDAQEEKCWECNGDEKCEIASNNHDGKRICTYEVKCGWSHCWNENCQLTGNDCVGTGDCLDPVACQDSEATVVPNGEGSDLFRQPSMDAQRNRCGSA